uniref:(California timema) hypothetical protein n=1 Tax=Timema californicum TaxID=61474 RepID=A0A7R9JFH0_TIMCA|nr:unnamed protein product [Timema californicum]
MSLFKVRDLWSTQCGVDETFDRPSLCLANIGGHSDKIVVGSHNGFLRVFQPSAGGELSGYKATDLLIETHLQHPILQVAAGKLVSGSQMVQLCVLHPRSVAVYSLVTKSGAAEHGDQNRLVLAYEHSLRRSSFCMVLGPFGGAHGRDFVCVQSLDGTLSFFEQETFAFTRFLPGFLLPGVLVFSSRTDSFITVASNHNVESYRYREGKLIVAKGSNFLTASSCAILKAFAAVDIKKYDICFVFKLNTCFIIGSKFKKCLWPPLRLFWYISNFTFKGFYSPTDSM